MRQSARGCTSISRNTAYYGKEKRGRDPRGLSCEAVQLDSGFFFSSLVSFFVCSCGAFCSMKIYWKVLPSPWWMPSAAWEAFQRLSADNVWLTGTLLNLWTVHTLQGRLWKQSGSAWENAPLPFICESLGPNRRQKEGRRRRRSQAHRGWQREEKEGRKTTREVRICPGLGWTLTGWRVPVSARWTWRCTPRLLWLCTAAHWFLAFQHWPRRSVTPWSAS